MPPAMLHVALQEGFFGDAAVVVTVNEDVVYDEDAVETDLRIGLADSFEVPLPEGPVRIHVRLPEQDLEAGTTVEATETIYVGVSVVDGQIEFRLSTTPFGYV